MSSALDPIAAIEARQDELDRKIDTKLEAARRLVAELAEVLKPDSERGGTEIG